MPYLPLLPGPAFKYLREINPNLIPVSHAAFYATNAVVVWIPHVIHYWAFQPQFIGYPVALCFCQSILNQRELMVVVRKRFNNCVCSVHLIHIITPHICMMVWIRCLPVSAYLFFQPFSAGCSKSCVYASGIFNYIIHIFVFI